MPDEVMDMDTGAEPDVTQGAPESDSAATSASAVPASESDSGAGVTEQEQNYYAAFRRLPQFQGLQDRDIANHLYETMQREQSQARALQQYQQLIPVASDYLANREMYSKWKEAQQAAPQQASPQPQMQQAQPQKDNWWNPPQVKDTYRQYLTRDAEGREVIAEHAPIEARAALTEWMNYRADFARKFLDNPEEALGPMVDRVASQRAAELVEQQMTHQRREQMVQRIEEENKAWLYSDPENKVASREGVIVQKYIEDVKAMGISDPDHRWNTAVAFLERDLALQVLQQMVEQQKGQAQAQPAALPASPPAPPPPNPAAEQAQKNMEFLRSQASRTATRNSPATTDPRVPKRPLTFAERLKADLQAEGISGLE
jgi:hypothetical protein